MQPCVDGFLHVPALSTQTFKSWVLATGLTLPFRLKPRWQQKKDPLCSALESLNPIVFPNPYGCHGYFSG